jgi:hypothetical protein
MATMKVKYQCDFCKRLYSNEKRAIWHEINRCTRNPSQHACLTCNFFHSKPITNEEYEMETQVCCTNMGFRPYNYDCDGWEERKPEYKQFVSFETSANVRDPNGRDNDRGDY